MSKLNQLNETGLTEKDIELLVQAVSSSSLSDSEKHNLSYKLKRIERDVSKVYVNPNQLELLFED